MCMCKKPNLNGTPGYSWDGKTTLTRNVDPPDIQDGDNLLFDEPGRCGGIDAHCHHYRLVSRHGQFFMLVRNGSGDERMLLSSWGASLQLLVTTMDSDTRFWFFNSLHHTVSNHTRKAKETVTQEWASAFVQKRIKKQKRQGQIKVWIEQPVLQDTTSEQY